MLRRGSLFFTLVATAMTIEEEIKQSKFRNARQKAGLNILYTANWLSGRHKEFFKTHGITSQQFNILRILRGQHPVKITGTEIRSRMLDQNSDVSRLLDRLVAKKLVYKTQCEDDKRSADILISEKGLELLSVIDTQHDVLDGSLNSLSEGEAAELSNLLDKARS